MCLLAVDDVSECAFSLPIIASNSKTLRASWLFGCGCFAMVIYSEGGASLGLTISSAFFCTGKSFDFVCFFTLCKHQAGSIFMSKQKARDYKKNHNNMAPSLI